jgi:uncharacterized membrane protein YkoI
MIRACMIAALVLCVAVPALAADDAKTPGCFSKVEQRALLGRREIIPLADAIRTARPHQIGDVLRAQLCQGPKGAPAYVLTLLPRSGKVTRVWIDARSGQTLDTNPGTVSSGSR